MEHKKVITVLLQVLGWFALQPLLSVFVSLAVALAIGIARAGNGQPYVPLSAGMLNLLLIVTNTLVLLVIWYAVRQGRPDFGAAIGLSTPVGGLWPVFLCVAGGVAANIWFSLVLGSGLVPEAVLERYTDSYALMEGGPPWLRFVAIVILAAVAEELLFRGIILGKLRAILPVWAAVLMQAFLFGLLHGEPLWILYAGLLGAVFGYIRVRTGSLLATIVFHMAFNVGSYLYSAAWPWLEGNAALGLLASGALFVAAIAALTGRRDGVVS